MSATHVVVPLGNTTVKKANVIPFHSGIVFCAWLQLLFSKIKYRLPLGIQKVSGSQLKTLNVYDL